MPVIPNGTENQEGGMKCNMQPPDLNKFSCYEDFIDRVKLWKITTDHKPVKLGPLLADALPDVSKLYGNKLATSLLKKHSAEDLYVENGLQKVIDFLDKKLGKSKVLSEITAFEAIYTFKRQPDQGIVPYISEFDLRINTCAATGLKLPDSVAAYILLLSSQFNAVQLELIKGLIDVNKASLEDNLYDKIKEKLITMLTSSLGNVLGEPEKDPFGAEAFLADNEEAFATWKHKKGNWKAPYKGRDGKSSYNNYNKGSKTRETNMKDENGRVLRCRGCGAHNHFIRECPFAKKDDKVKTFQKFKGKNGKVYLCQLDSSDEDNSKDESEEELYYTAVMYTTDRKDLSRFTAEAINCGALDSCCTCTCAGKKWLTIYLNSLPEDMKKMVKGPFNSGKTFMFGNEGKLTAEAAYDIPIKVAGKTKLIKVDIIDSDIPLLLSKAEMKTLGMTLDMKNDAAYINGKPLKVSTTSAGHLIMDLLEQDDVYLLEELLVVDLKNASENEQEKLLNKVHKQFGHRTKRVFVSLLKDTNNWLPEFSGMLDKIIEKCEGCIMSKKTPDRPSVALPRAQDFNEILTMDLKIWNGKYILYMIDMFSRYTVATVIPRKKPAEVINAIFKHWVKYFGVPGSVMTDNGGEFTGEEMRNVTSYLNVYKDTTAAEAPWMNGVNERNHALADNILRQVTRDYPELDLATAIAWACTAKNSLTNVYGYSPFQLVFGKNPRLPNVINDPPSSWAIVPQSEALLKNLKALHATREAFIKAEKSEKLKIALKTKIRTVDRVYKPGDYCFYKRDKDTEFKGPAKVIFQDGKIIWIRHGSYICKVSINRLQPVSDELARGYRATESPESSKSAVNKGDNNDLSDKDTYTRSNHIQDEVRDYTIAVHSDSESDHDNSYESAHEDSDNIQSEDDHDDHNQNVQNSDNVHQNNPEIDAAHNDDQDDDQNQNAHSSDSDHQYEANDAHNHAASDAHNHYANDAHNHDANTDDIPSEHSSEEEDNADLENNQEESETEGTQSNPIIIKKFDRIEIKDTVETNGTWEKATVTGRAGKASRHPTSWNVECDNGKKFWADFSEIEIRKMPEEDALAVYTHEEIMAVMIPKDQQDSQECMTAKYNELKKLQDFNTYEVIDDIGQTHITCTWVMTRKGEEPRARLTARGFQEDAEFPSDSPTLQKANLRTILAMTAAKNWDITATDIKSAFLQGSDLEREVFVKPPREANLKGKLWKLRKCLYGLKDASRNWYKKVESKLEKAGFVKSYHDESLFYLTRNGQLIGIIGVHVDDFISCGTPEFCNKILPKVLSAFQIGKLESHKFLYTGFNVVKRDNKVTLDQKDYISRIEIPILNAERLLAKEDDITPKELTTYRHMVGCTNWVGRATRPDLNYDIVSLSTKFKGGKIEDLKDARKVLTNIVHNEASIVFSCVGDLTKAELWLYTDASLGNLNNGVDSTGSYILLLINPRNGKCAPLDWKSNKIQRVVTSTLAAETLSLYAGLDAAIAMRSQLRSMLGNDHNLNLRAMIDNKSTYDVVHAAVSLTKEKRLRKEIGAIKQMRREGKLKELKWVPAGLMLADALTKKGGNTLKLMKVMQSGVLGEEYLESVR